MTTNPNRFWRWSNPLLYLRMAILALPTIMICGILLVSISSASMMLTMDAVVNHADVLDTQAKLHSVGRVITGIAMGLFLTIISILLGLDHYVRKHLHAPTTGAQAFVYIDGRADSGAQK